MICKKWFRENGETVLLKTINEMFSCSNKVLFYSYLKLLFNWKYAISVVSLNSRETFHCKMFYLEFGICSILYTRICTYLPFDTKFNIITKHKFCRSHCIIVHNMINKCAQKMISLRSIFCTIKGNTRK